MGISRIEREGKGRTFQTEGQSSLSHDAGGWTIVLLLFVQCRVDIGKGENRGERLQECQGEAWTVERTVRTKCKAWLLRADTSKAR